MDGKRMVWRMGGGGNEMGMMRWETGGEGEMVRGRG